VKNQQSDTEKSADNQLGIVSVSSKGLGYLALQDENGLSDKKRDRQEDPEIQPDKLHTALHGDEVEVRLLGKKSIERKPPRMQAEVLQIIKRAKMEFVGVLEQERGQYFLVPDDRRVYKDILIKKSDDTQNNTGNDTGKSSNLVKTKITPGIKAFVRMTGWEDGKNPEGEIIKLLGRKGDNNVEMESIVLEKGFETGFPAEVEREAEQIERTEKPIPAEEISRRRDFRQTMTVTIDPADAKDFDDAISFKSLGRIGTDGKADPKAPELYEIGVHIADVSHYVRERIDADANGRGGRQSALDKEAVKRGCSIYLVDRTIPMLPEVLSNDICSLNPDDDRLTFSAVFEINENAEISKRWFGKTIIHSHKRFTYENAQASIDAFAGFIAAGANADKGAKSTDHKPTTEKTTPFGAELTILNNIAKKLAAKKFANGAIDFEKDEVKFELDPEGKPIRVYRKERLATHKLVEEYMLLANREVAEFLFKKMEEERKKGAGRTAAIYRIHETPDPDKITDLSIFVRALGFDLESHGGKVTSRAIRKLLDDVTGSPQEELIKTATIRSMAKAVYSTQNIGHFGLGFKYYTHFTSPIRRYPDLLVQRVLHTYLQGKHLGEHESARFEALAARSTEREILAAEAERASIKYKQVEFMQNKVGQTFEGTITGVTEWGVYVEENETKCEGMIKVRDIGDVAGDFFSLDEKNYTLIGDKTGKKFTLGNKIHFKVLAADMERKALDYGLVVV
jgi:ribonuclease R